MLRGISRVKPSWLKEGGKYKGFVVVNQFEVPEFDLVAYHLEHEKTKCKYVHLDSADTSNTFSVVFRTPVTNSTGVPHILEHTVLCGSERYPVRDPFFNMTKRSLNIFMNAMTASDHTMYPFSTRNSQDFNNLLSVYLDATFFPKLSKPDFLQEGHRLEFVDEKLKRTGIVYNEMKGTLGGSASLFFTRLQQNMFRGSVYENVSGGEPKHIHELTHEALVEFHKVHYHPSNAMLFTYGDLPIETHIDMFETQVLDKFNFSQAAQDVQSMVSATCAEFNTSFVGREPVRLKGPLEPMLDSSKQAKICFSKRVAIADDQSKEYRLLVLRILSNLLIEGANAPMYTGLIDSQMADDFGPGTGLDTHIYFPSFGIAVQGVAVEDVWKIRKRVEEVALDVATNGFDQRRVDAILHQVELSMKKKPLNFGLPLMQTTAGSFTHSNDIIQSINESITVTHKIDQLITDMKVNPRFWHEQVSDLLLVNTDDGMKLDPEFLTVVMEPDDSYTTNLEGEESRELASLAATLSTADIENIKDVSKELEQLQNIPQDVSCLPTLSIDDIPRYPDEVISFDNPIDGNTFLWVENQSTNGIVYVRQFYDTSSLPEELQVVLPTLCSLLGSTDTKDYSYQELNLRSDLLCSGFRVTPLVSTWDGTSTNLLPETHRLVDGANGHQYRKGIVVSFHCLERNLDSSLELLSSMLCRSSFASNSQRIETLIASEINGASSSLTNDALGYARKWASASLGGEHALRELHGGISQTEFIKQSKNIPLVELDQLLPCVFAKENLATCVVAGGPDIHRDKTQQSLLSFKLPPRLSRYDGALVQFGLPFMSSVHQRAPQTASYIGLPIAVHNVAAIIPTDVCFGHEDDAAMMVLGQVISSNYLHQQIREKGGAYGGGAAHGSGGLFQLYSYYDPNCKETLAAFADGISWACDGSFESRDVDEALLSVFGSVDAPQELRTKGTGQFLHGTTASERQCMRDRFFQVDRQRLIDACQRHLGSFAQKSSFVDAPIQACVAIAGNKDNSLFTNENPGWLRKSIN